MRILSIFSVLFFSIYGVGCDLIASTSRQTQARSVSIAGMPVAEKDYQLTAGTEQLNPAK